eukprot:TRINITY_DN35084_c0_g1_i1.p1 TRINITY_DN35084_c0_g1~~TRINITY_DN35084_c0_g1_i1.p1  ORF type:complete len:475 (+),score=56.73 TRINITY_DN35084_c0_g1_i1:121-1425(+)
MAVSVAHGLAAKILRALRDVKKAGDFVADRPLLFVFLLQLAGVLRRWWAAKRRLQLARNQVLNPSDDLDSTMIHGCLVSAENLVSLGRVEQRTLFKRPMREVFGGNQYLIDKIIKVARECRRIGHSSMVVRRLDQDERYLALQGCLNAMSSLFGANYVHLNALDGEIKNLFKMTWYCLTITLPAHRECESGKDSTCTFTDMAQTPGATLRAMIVNETELRRIADGKLKPPNWGFFNGRHEERYGLLVDLAKNFKWQLLRTPADGRSIPERNPFTSEKVHADTSETRTTAGEISPSKMKRVQSQPGMQGSSIGDAWKSSRSGMSRGSLNLPGGLSGRGARSFTQQVPKSPAARNSSKGSTGLDINSPRNEDDANCFLRLHVPHYLGPTCVPNICQDYDGNGTGAKYSSTLIGLKKLVPVSEMCPVNVTEMCPIKQ